VRVHTNSWGSASNSYSANARSVDQFTNMYQARPAAPPPRRTLTAGQDMLILFANGNSGDDGAHAGRRCRCCGLSAAL
jgi:hypothetical protein